MTKPARCGAPTKTGSKCRNKPVDGNERCRLHPDDEEQAANPTTKTIEDAQKMVRAKKRLNATKLMNEEDVPIGEIRGVYRAELELTELALFEEARELTTGP